MASRPVEEACARRVPGCRGQRTVGAVGRRRGRDRQDHCVAGRASSGPVIAGSGCYRPAPRGEFRAGIRVTGRPADRRGTRTRGLTCPSLSGSRSIGCCLREQAADAVTDQRAVAAAFLSVVDRLADDGPVLLAIDDLQWLDPSSRSRDRIRCASAVRSGGTVGHRPHRARQQRLHLVAAIAPSRCHPPNPGASVVFT